MLREVDRFNSFEQMLWRLKIFWMYLSTLSLLCWFKLFLLATAYSQLRYWKLKIREHREWPESMSKFRAETLSSLWWNCQLWSVLVCWYWELSVMVCVGVLVLGTVSYGLCWCTGTALYTQCFLIETHACVVVSPLPTITQFLALYLQPSGCRAVLCLVPSVQHKVLLACCTPELLWVLRRKRWREGGEIGGVLGKGLSGSNVKFDWENNIEGDGSVCADEDQEILPLKKVIIFKSEEFVHVLR